MHTRSKSKHDYTLRLYVGYVIPTMGDMHGCTQYVHLISRKQRRQHQVVIIAMGSLTCATLSSEDIARYLLDIAGANGRAVRALSVVALTTLKHYNAALTV